MPIMYTLYRHIVKTTSGRAVAITAALMCCGWLIFTISENTAARHSGYGLHLASYQPPDILPAPAADEVAHAKKVLAELYRDDFAKAKQASGSQMQLLLKQLSATIAKLAETETDPVKLYAIFEVSVEIGKQSCSIIHTSQLIDQYQTRFSIDGHQLKARVGEYCLLQIPKNFRSIVDQRAAWKELAEHMAEQGDAVAKAGQWQIAESYYALAGRSSSRIPGQPSTAKYKQLALDMQARSTRQTRIDQLLQQLPTAADKASLNLEIGTYYCCELDKWQTGLPYLQDCSDQELAAAARADMAATASDGESTGDLWWDLSLSESHQAHRMAFQKRAATHYSLALKTTTGLSHAKITKRLLTVDAATPGEERLPGLVNQNPSIDLGLKWLAKQQRSNGSWSLIGPYVDGAAQEDTTAATSMALLAFVRSGHGALKGEYQENVQKGLAFLMRRQDREGFFAGGEPAHNQAYSQALASLVMLEIYAHSQNPKYKLAATNAVKYAQWSQGTQGGWRYTPREDSDASVTGWYVNLLTMAKESKFDVDADVLKKADAYLDTLSHEGGSRYGYRKSEPPTLTITAEAFMSRLAMGMPLDHPALQKAIAVDLLPNKPATDAQMSSVYFTLHATEVMRRVGGDPWTQWRSSLRQTLNDQQARIGNDAGSWSPEKDQFGPSGGRLYVTCFNIYCQQIAELYP